MAIYDYKAYSTDGKSKRGLVEAENQKAARAKLKKQGLMVTDITERNVTKQSAKSAGSLFGGGVSAKETTMMTRQLASLVKANITLVEALSAVTEQCENERLKGIMSQVRQDVNE